MLEWGRRDAENVAAEERGERCDAREEHEMGMRARGEERSLSAVIPGRLSCRHADAQRLAPDPSPHAPDSRKGLRKSRP